jgi:hypothetical protein
MKAMLAAVVVTMAAVVGCGGSADPGAHGDEPAVQPDAGAADTAPAAEPDAGPDTAAPEPDAGPAADTGAPKPDAGPTAPQDSGADAARTDSGTPAPDAAAPDTGPVMVCTTGEVKCEGLTSSTCSGAGQWVATACTYACNPYGGCTGVCAPNSTRCNAGTAETCNASNAWASVGACAAGCYEQEPGRFAVGDSGATVHDATESLTWERHPSPAGATQAQAAAYCAALTTAGGGWRLPTLAELASLVPPGTSTCSPKIDQVAFPGTATAVAYWTSTPAGGEFSVVRFATGSSTTSYPASTPLVARCVR